MPTRRFGRGPAAVSSLGSSVRAWSDIDGAGGAPIEETARTPYAETVRRGSDKSDATATPRVEPRCGALFAYAVEEEAVISTRRSSSPSAEQGRVRSQKRCALLAMLLCCLSLQSCFTTILWGLDQDGDEWAGESGVECDDDTEWTWDLFLGRLLLTPIAIGLDALTCPVQSFFWGEDDERRDCKRRR